MISKKLIKKFNMVILILFTLALGACNFSKNSNGIIPPERGVEEINDSIVEGQVDENNTYEIGNTSGNLLIAGIIAEKGDWIYYSNVSDNMRLYKKKKDGSEQAILSERTAYFVNVVGQWVYFYAGFGDKETGEPGIYRVKSDGTQEEIIISEGLDENINHLVVIGQYIYYSSMEFDLSDGAVEHRVSEQSGDSLYKIKVDGSSKEKILDKTLGKFLIYGDSVYYSSKESNNYNDLYKKSLAGGAATKIISGITSEFLIEDKYIYFKDSEGFGNLYRKNIDAGEGEKIIEDVAYFNVDNDWIYYTKSKEITTKISDNGDSVTDIMNTGLYRINKNGEESQKVLTESKELMDSDSSSIYITDDSIYCWNANVDTQEEFLSSDMKLFNISKDDNEVKFINKGVFNISLEALEDNIREDVNLLKLSIQEDIIYNNYFIDFDDSLLKDLEPLSICRFFIYSAETNNYKMAVELYAKDKDSEGVLKQQYFNNIANNDNVKNTLNNAETIQIRYSKGNTEATIIFNNSRLLENDEEIPESSQVFILSKDEDGIWKVDFSPKL
ncbi:DUF5050 domain-containing protein [Clostridium grantii]|uniref:Prolow-density lipoprotein receptor-related protein 1-like beta-propeller domain-containing protein n=1 Tax=Clostridium grantii DSM 8605 TaxID=1121316 RepID=A0A1M5WU68_9CLOT|nr:DUF5050 domain-containing protein [Clostridium grantii]SHH90990.1 protein of unknown function [Clostridium grantii DSM 8605]